MKPSSLSAGALAGARATVPMTLVLFGMAPFLPHVKAFPPKMAVKMVTGKAGLWQRLSARQRNWLSWSGHFGYGALMGSMYARITKKYEVSGVESGVAFGVAVWAGSYLGVLPALGIKQPLRKRFWDDHVQLVAAHLVWGAVLGWLEKGSNKKKPAPVDHSSFEENLF